MEKGTSGVDIKAYNDQGAFIWQLLSMYFQKIECKEITFLATSVYEQKFEFSDVFEELILNLWDDVESINIFNLALEAVNQNIFDLTKHSYLVSKLVESKKLRISDAVKLMQTGTLENYTNLDARIKRLVDVLWLVKEDAREGVMSPNDDDLLRITLSEIRDIFEAS